MPRERRAALQVTARVTDPAEARELLAMLGLAAARQVEPAPMPSSGVHGKATSYDNGCRCERCRAAATAKARAWRARVRQDPAAADRAGHGKSTTYKNYGCRCDECRQAQRDSLAAAKARRAARAAADGGTA